MLEHGVRNSGKGSGADFTNLLLREGFFLSDIMGGFGNNSLRVLSLCRICQLLYIICLNCGVQSENVVTNVSMLLSS